MKLGRLIDLKRCMGCRSCVAACAVENHFTPDAPWNVMIEYEVGTYPNVKKVFNTMGCMHCENPSCKMACDAVGAKAITKNEFGMVIYDYDKCIGCGYCASVCPYGVPQLNAKIEALAPGKEKLGAENLDYADRHPTHRKKSNVQRNVLSAPTRLIKRLLMAKLTVSAKTRLTRQVATWFARCKRGCLATLATPIQTFPSASRPPMPNN